MSVFKKLRDSQRFNRDHWERAHVALQNQTMLARVGNMSLAAIIKLLTVAPAIRRVLTRRPKPGSSPARSGQWSSAVGAASAGLAPLTKVSRAARGHRILTVGEFSLARCADYRIEDKKEMWRGLKIEWSEASWLYTDAAREKLQNSGLVIFYRVHAWPAILELIAEARRLGIPSFFEIDDLIFDEESCRGNANFQRLSPGDQKRLLSDAESHRAVLAAVDHAIASTAEIAETMRTTCRGDVLVIENRFHEREASDSAYDDDARVARSDGTIVIGYGSGSRTHDADFAVAAPALAEILQRYSHVRLLLVGELSLPQVLEPFADRIRRIGPLAWVPYGKTLSTFSINLAPLETSKFNDGKSNIKFLEAATYRIPTVCSPARHFRETVTHGVDGFLAETTEEWVVALSALVEQPDLRRRIGAAAHATGMTRFSDEAIATKQVVKLLSYLPKPLAPRDRRRIRLIIVDDAEAAACELAQSLISSGTFDVLVLTTTERPGLSSYECVRYEQADVPVAAIKLPKLQNRVDIDDHVMSFDEAVGDVFAGFRPDVVHLQNAPHLVQAVNARWYSRDLPYLVSVQDGWWLCPRHATVNGDCCSGGRIDLTFCASKSPDPDKVFVRADIMRRVLSDAALLLPTDAATRDLYLANGFAEDKLAPPPREIAHAQKTPPFQGDAEYLAAQYRAILAKLDSA